MSFARVNTRFASRASSRTIHTHLLEHGAVDYLIHLSKQRCDLSESIGYLKFFSSIRWFETWAITPLGVDMDLL